MASPEAVVSTAAGGFLVVATTTLIQRLYTSHTAAGRAQALEELYNTVERRHLYFVKKVLPQLQEANRMKEFPDVDGASMNLVA